MQKNWLQTQLADKLNTHPKQVSKYERGINLPSTNVRVRMMQIFNASADYLFLEKRDKKDQISIAGRKLFHNLSKIDKLLE